MKNGGARKAAFQFRTEGRPARQHRAMSSWRAGGLPVHHDCAADILGDNVVGGPGGRALFDEGHLGRDTQQPV